MSDIELNKIALATVETATSEAAKRKTITRPVSIDCEDQNGLFTISYDQEETTQRGLSTRDGANLRAVATGIVSGLVESAELHARQFVTVQADTTAQDVWAEMLESLDAAGLTPTIYCNKSGRVLGEFNPSHWSDYLAQIAKLGESVQGDHIRGQLLGAMTSQKAYSVAPVVLTTSGASLAMIRETSAADFIAVALGHLFPANERWQSETLALRAENLGRARASLELLPDSALQYTCEVLTLYLSYIRPRLLHNQGTLLDYYRDDLAAPFQSVETLGHFCGRIVQMLVDLLARHTLRPVNQIRPSDLRALRVHWQGYEPYRVLRVARREWRLGKESERKRIAQRERANNKRNILADVFGGPSHQRRLDDLDQNTVNRFSDVLADAFDLSAVLTAGGRPTPVHTKGDEETAQALARANELRTMKEESRAQAADNAADLEALEGLDISALILSNTLPAHFTSFTDDDDLAASLGLVDLPDFDFDDYQEDDDDDSDDLAANLQRLLDEQQADAIQEAMQSATVKARPKLSLAAQDRAASVAKAASALAFPSPKRQVIRATAAPAAKPAFKKRLI